MRPRSSSASSLKVPDRTLTALELTCCFLHPPLHRKQRHLARAGRPPCRPRLAAPSRSTTPRPSLSSRLGHMARPTAQASSSATRRCASSCSDSTPRARRVRPPSLSSIPPPGSSRRRRGGRAGPLAALRARPVVRDNLTRCRRPAAILYKLKLNQSVTTIPTVGFNVETVTYKNVKCVVSSFSACELKPVSRGWTRCQLMLWTR